MPLARFGSVPIISAEMRISGALTLPPKDFLIAPLHGQRYPASSRSRPCLDGKRPRSQVFEGGRDGAGVPGSGTGSESLQMRRDACGGGPGPGRREDRVASESTCKVPIVSVEKSYGFPVKAPIHRGDPPAARFRQGGDVESQGGLFPDRFTIRVDAERESTTRPTSEPKGPHHEDSEMVPRGARDGRGVPGGWDGCRPPPQYLDQGWTAADRMWFYNTSQGSRLIPYQWFLALEQPAAAGLFKDPAYIAQFGYLTPLDVQENPDGLPIGFVRDVATLRRGLQPEGPPARVGHHEGAISPAV